MTDIEEKDVQPADAPKKPKRLDPRKTAQRQIKAHLAGKSVSPGRMRLATERHAVAVQAAGEQVPLDWHTRQILAPTWGVAR